MKQLPLTATDNLELRVRLRFFYVLFGVVGGLALITGLIVGHFKYHDIAGGFLYIALPLNLLLWGAGIFSILPVRRDQREQVKLAGDFAITKDIVSNRYNTSFYLKVNDPEIKKVLVSKEVYDNVLPGEILYLEVAKHSRYPFQVRRNGVSVVPGKP
jgi:hypothetical protein